jgi:uncharacterized RDD family membrane protein YckC
VAADPDRRFYAWVIDRLLSLTGYAAGAVAAYFALIEPGHTLAGVAAVGALALVLWFVGALMTGLAGVTPGKSLCGLKVVSASTGEPIGLAAALLRQAIVGLGGYPTLGVGDATLAWMATLDGAGLRRAWHDRVAGSVVVDVRPQPAAPVVEEQLPDRVVNLTALRLVPAEEQPPVVPPAPPAPAPAAPPAVSAAVPSAGSSAAPRHAAPQAPSVPTPAPVAVPLPPAAAAPAAPSRWRVTFDTGQSFVVEGLALVGRSPEPRPGEQAAHLVPLQSGDMSLSKTHAQFGVVPDGTLVVMDRGSTNGSTLLRGGVARPLPARQPATLLPGDRVRFGDREMTVVREG